MPITIELPQVGESVVEGIIGKWLKKPGDRLEKYDPLVEVVTDKVTMEVPSPVNGVLTRILAEEGATVSMGAPIAEMESEDASDEQVAQAPPSQQPASGSPGAAMSATIGYLVKDVRQVGPTGGGTGDQTPVEAPATAETPPAQVASQVEVPRATVTVPGDRARFSPAVRRLAREHGVDPAGVKGTGLGGRITRDDVLKAVEGGAATKAESAGTPAMREVAAGPEEEALPLSPVRRIIAQNMVRSSSEIPHAWSMVEANVDALVKFRRRVKDEFLRRKGVDLTYLPFIVKAAVESLKEHPFLNASWGGDKIILKKRIHLGLAVAAPDGLVVPVIHNADQLSISGLAKEARRLTEKARQGKLAIEDVQGGTFTVNNTGALGSIVSQPLINFPQVAILTSEAIEKRAVVIGDAIAVRHMMNICLSFDHRVIDGAQAGAFLSAVKRRLEAAGPDTPIY